MSEYEPKVLLVYSAASLCWILGCIVGELSLAQPATNTVPGNPSIPIARAAIAPSVGVTLRWDKGTPPETTVSNLTTRTSIYAGLADAVMFSGLVLGSTNRFLAFNSSGSTPVLTTLAVTQDLRCSIKVFTYLVTVPIKSNSPTSIMTSTNLVTWNQIAQVQTTNSTYSFVWTNDGGNRFFRSTSP